MREGRRQIGRHDAWDQECQPDEAEAVQDEKRPQRFGPFPEAEFWPDVSCCDDPPRDEAECDAQEKAELRQHESFLWFEFQRSIVTENLSAQRAQLCDQCALGLSLR